MKVYTCTNFKGHWPVGAAAVVVASSKASAAQLLHQHLRDNKLKQDKDWKPELELLPLTPRVRILHDGDY